MLTQVIGQLFVGLVYAAALCSAGGEDDTDSFIGWNGATYVEKQAFGYGFTKPVKVAERPLAYVWKNFISREEAKHVAQLAVPHLRHSLVGDNEKSENIRTSYGMFIPRFQDATVAAISERVAEWTGLPLVNQEAMQVLRYSPGQVYKPHMDSHGRMVTVLIYLSDTTVGGETAFPNTSDEHWTHPGLKPEGLSAGCAEGHLSIKPEVGLAFLFYSMPPGAESNETLRVEDPWALHTGCPPAPGQIKWTATIWIRAEPFRPEDFSKEYPKPAIPDSAACEDLNPDCEAWAAQGQCEMARGYMLGEVGSHGHCLRACGACEVCAADDRACGIGNRERLGFLGDLESEVAALYPELRLQ